MQCKLCMHGVWHIPTFGLGFASPFNVIQFHAGLQVVWQVFAYQILSVSHSIWSRQWSTSQMSGSTVAVNWRVSHSVEMLVDRIDGVDGLISHPAGQCQIDIQGI